MAESAQRPRENYTHRDNTAVENAFTGRSALGDAGFLLDYLKPGMSLLDVGSGPGTITVGLAEFLSPGQVTGVDIQAGQVEQSRALAATRGLDNLRFEVADCYELPFPDDSFDVVFSHALLMHLSDPVKALKEMRRVLKPGGVLGVRDADSDADFFSPLTPLLQEYRDLIIRVRRHNGRVEHYASHCREYLLAAGFERSETTASISSWGSLERTQGIASWVKSTLKSARNTAIAEGWTDDAKLDSMDAELDAWGNRPDAFRASLYFASVAWKPNPQGNR